jgi:membrane-bound ClpP family serine protease
MTLVLSLLAAGVLLLAVELVVPGAVIGVVGALCMLAGVLAAFGEFGVSGGFITLAGVMVVLTVVIYIELVWLPKSALAKWLSMSTTLTEQSQPPVADAATVVGAAATAETVMAPSGYVRVNGRRYEAFCRDGHATEGANLRVVSVDNFRLIVTRAE